MAQQIAPGTIIPLQASSSSSDQPMTDVVVHSAQTNQAIGDGMQSTQMAPVEQYQSQEFMINNIKPKAMAFWPKLVFDMT